MKIVLIPYQFSRSANRSSQLQVNATQMIQRLTTYLGEIPPDAKIATDHWQEGRLIAAMIENAVPTVDTYVYPWLNPGMRKRPSQDQFNQLCLYISQSKVPMFILISPSHLIGSYADKIVQHMKIKTSKKFEQSTGREIIIFDLDSSETVRIINT